MGQKKKYSTPVKTCETCSNCVYIGEGDHICLESDEEPHMVISGWSPTDEYMACGGKRYED